jgi:hypothetical protein
MKEQVAGARGRNEIFDRWMEVKKIVGQWSCGVGILLAQSGMFTIIELNF